MTRLFYYDSSIWIKTKIEKLNICECILEQNLYYGDKYYRKTIWYHTISYETLLASVFINIIIL